MDYVTTKVHPMKGRCYFAAADIPAGAVIMRSSPYSVIPDSPSKGKVCTACFSFTHLESIPTVLCTEGGCDQVVYCSMECRNHDWGQYHQYECESFQYWKRQDSLQGLSEYARDYLWLLIRLLIRRTQETFSRDSAVKIESITKDSKSGTFDQVWNLISNRTQFSDSQLEEFDTVAKVLEGFLLNQLLPKIRADKGDLDADILKFPVDPRSEVKRASADSWSLRESIHDSLIDLICKEECNSFGLYTYQFEGSHQPRQGYALALYTSPVFFNHSCVPNVGHVTFRFPRESPKVPDLSRKPEMVFFATRAISKGEELLLSYVETSDPDDGTLGETRRKQLKDIFFFDCDCIRCDAERSKNEAALKKVEELLDFQICLNDGCRGLMVPPELGLVEKIGQPESGAWTCEGCGLVRTIN
ncbi:hypothetical protein BJ742DRAFT_839211 [Cladochytrium replicatum]|nr:hypothetical protein BJ742DRAFT_839211 [Cladochytrium replicatum]